MVRSITPMIAAENLKDVKEFYVGRLGFQVSFEHEAYLGLRLGPDGPELGFLKPHGHLAPFDGKGLSLALKVDDVDAEFRRLGDQGVAFVQTPQDNPWGDRSAICLDPVGLALYLYHEIQAAPEFEGCKKEGDAG